jgi:hypothetical protein
MGDGSDIVSVEGAATAIFEAERDDLANDAWASAFTAEAAMSAGALDLADAVARRVWFALRNVAGRQRVVAVARAHRARGGALLAKRRRHWVQARPGGGRQFPDWVSDGSATYLATLHAGHGEHLTESAWRVRWLGRPNNSLTTRDYDAAGWYALVAKESGSLWPKMVAAWTAYLQSGANAYIAALGGDTPAVASAWVSSLLNTPAGGDVWMTPGVGVQVGLQPTMVSLLGPADASNGIQIDPLAAIVDTEKIDAHDPHADGLIEISVTDGDASVHDADIRSYIGFADEAATVCKS